MVKRITRHGNGSAIALDQTILEQLGLKIGDQVQLTCSSGSVVITPVHGVIPDAQFAASQAKMLKRYRTTLQHLAK